MNSAAQDLLAEIRTAEAGKSKLLKQLDSSLSIQAIWPTAYAHHGDVAFGGRLCYGSRVKGVTTQGFIEAYFRATDGRVYWLTVEELQAFKPGAIITANKYQVHPADYVAPYMQH